PSSRRRDKKAAVVRRSVTDVALMYPTIGSFVDCCARAASGQTAAAPTSVMNRRRRRSNISQPLPWLRRWSVYRTISLLRRAPQVLGVGLNCSELVPSRETPMSALGQKRTLDGHLD